MSQLRPDDLPPEVFQELLEQGLIKVQTKTDDIHLLSQWNYKDKRYWICKLGKNDFSLFDGIGILDVSWDSRTLAEEAMRSSGASRVFKKAFKINLEAIKTAIPDKEQTEKVRSKN